MSKIWIWKKSKRVQETPKGVVAPPIAYSRLIEAYRKNAYHAGALDVKAINILGNGLKDENVNRILAERSVGCSLHMLLEQTIRDMVIFGNAYWELAQGQIFHVPAWTMYRSENGWVQKVDKEKVEYALDEIWHFKTGSLASSFYGEVNYEAILPAVELMGTIREYNTNFFSNNAIPDFAIIVEGGVLSPTAEYNIKRFLGSKFKGTENAHKVLYLPVSDGMKVNFEKIQSDRDMQFEKQDESCISEIIACHGVPPRLLGIHVPGKLGGAGETTGELQIFYRTRIAPLQNIIGGYLDSFMQIHAGIKTDITFDSFDYEDDSAATALSYLRG